MVVGLICELPDVLRAMTGNRPRSQVTHDVSKRCRLPGRVVPKRLFYECIEFSGGNIALKLAIPKRPVKFKKPCTKLRKLFRRERLDLLLDRLDFAHICNPQLESLAPPIFCRLTSPLSRRASGQSPLAKVGLERFVSRLFHGISISL